MRRMNVVPVMRAVAAICALLWCSCAYAVDLGVTVQADIVRPNNTTTYTANTAWANATSSASASTFSGLCSIASGSALVPDVMIIDYANQATKLTGELHLFKKPVSAPIADNATWNISLSSPNDIQNQVAIIAFSLTNVDNSGGGAAGAQSVNVQGPMIQLSCDTLGNVYGMVKVTNAYVPVANEKLTILIKGAQQP